jgi:DNA-binding response OmpR family regulator
MGCKLKVIVAYNQQTSSILCTNYLSRHNMEVVQTHSLSELTTVLSSFSADMLLFDLSQADGDGMSFIQKIGFKQSMGVIVFTYEDELIDKLITLETCADDFIRKPCNFREVVARIRAVHRRIQFSKKQDSMKLYCNDFVIDCLSRTVTLNSGRTLNLTRHEFDVLSKLVRHKNRPISRQTLVDAISDYERDVTFRSIDSVIYRLRNKFSKNIPIKTAYGVGYIFEDVTPDMITPTFSLDTQPFYQMTDSIMKLANKTCLTIQ